MANNKNEAWEKLESLLDGEEATTLISYLCDYFSTNELNGLIEHIEDELG